MSDGDADVADTGLPAAGIGEAAAESVAGVEGSAASAPAAMAEAGQHETFWMASTLR